MKYDAFISYRRENGFLMAQVILYRLKEKGINCFLDLEEDRSGEFDENLFSAIKEAPNFILVLPKKALDRCVNEDDWVRKEIIAAVREGKRIIPIMYDGFSWPTKWPDGTPEEIVNLPKNQGVVLSQEYISAMIEKIITYMENINPHGNVIELVAEDFFRNEVLNREDIKCVCMAFHAGAGWRNDSEMLDILAAMLNKKIKIRVLVNSPEAAESVCNFMKQPLKKYVSFKKSIEDWKEIEADYPQQIEVRIVKVPLMHRVYLVQRENDGAVNVKYYGYGSYNTNKDFRMCFGSDQREYSIYSEEFEFLWNMAESCISEKDNHEK